MTGHLMTGHFLIGTLETAHWTGLSDGPVFGFEAVDEGEGLIVGD